jgi:hypothetical protein
MHPATSTVTVARATAEAGPSVGAVHRTDAVGSTADKAASFLEAVGSLKDTMDVTCSAADALSDVLRRDPSAALAVIAECSSAAAFACNALAPGLAFVAPALVVVGGLLKQVANAAANPGLVTALARRLLALRPVLRAAARSDTFAREHEPTLTAMTSVLKDAAGAVERVTTRGFLGAMWNASGDRAKIEAAEADIDKWVTVLTGAIAVALGSEVHAAVVAASAAAVKAQDELLAQLAGVGSAIAAAEAEARVFQTKLDGALERQKLMVRCLRAYVRRVVWYV